MLRLTTLNANGIRAAARKWFFTWLRGESPDVLCIQETKAQEHQLPPEALDLGDYYAFVDAEKKGYSGVAIYAKRKPERIVRGFGMPDIDAEGRFVRFDWGDLSIASLYVPSGTSGPVRQAVKNGFLERFLAFLAELRHDGRRYILCGDFNIAHKAIDTFDPVRNATVTGFLPHERAWMDTVVEQVGWVDAFREVDPEPRRYTWWSNWQGASIASYRSVGCGAGSRPICRPAAFGVERRTAHIGRLRGRSEGGGRRRRRVRYRRRRSRRPRRGNARARPPHADHVAYRS
jgi:exodeoxyribonuclease-3